MESLAPEITEQNEPLKKKSAKNEQNAVNILDGFNLY